MWNKTMMAVAWPAFMAACLLEAGVFALIDPSELGWSRQALYGVGFFGFWLACTLSSATALWLLRQPPRASVAA